MCADGVNANYPITVSGNTSRGKSGYLIGFHFHLTIFLTVPFSLIIHLVNAITQALIECAASLSQQ